MAQYQSQTIPVPTSVTQGAAVPLSGYRSARVFFKLSGAVLTVQFQISDDGTVWHNIGSALSADGFVDAIAPAQFVRADVTAFTSGAALAEVSGNISA